jgi:hypothetical protein
VTDEVNYQRQDRTDWYVVQLRGRPGVLATEVHWDNDKSDLMIDIFDQYGGQIAASPVRAHGEKNKKLLTQIDKIGSYYVRVTAPGKNDGTVYTVEAKWDEPPEEPVRPPPVVEKIIEPAPEPPRPRRKPREEKPREEAPSASIQGHIVQVYRESGALTLQIDKGSSAGVRNGMNGTVLLGPSGEEALDGGDFRIFQVVDKEKSLGRTALRSIGRNTRVMINLK